MTINYQIVGKRIRDKRIEQRLSQEALSEDAHITPSTLSLIESGKQHVSLESLVSIADALNVTADALLYGGVENVTAEYGTDMDALLASCTSSERLFIKELAKAAKSILAENGWTI